MSDQLFSNPYDFTIIKNVIFDHIMPSLSSDGWKVLCAAIRHTWGWTGDEAPLGSQENARLSVAQFMEKTGLQEQDLVERAIEECLEFGYLVSYQVGQDAQMGEQQYVYALYTGFEVSDLTPAPLAEGVVEVESREEMMALSPGQASALQALMAFGHDMGTDPDLAQLQQAVVQNDADAVMNWIEIGRAMTNLAEPLRFQTVVQRLLDRVPALPLSMLAPDPSEELPAPKPEPAILDAGELWQATLSELQSQLRKNKFKWLEPTRAVALAEGVLTVEAPNKRTKEWLEEGQLATTIQQTLNAVAGEPIEVRFVVGE